MHRQQLADTEIKYSGAQEISCKRRANESSDELIFQSPVSAKLNTQGQLDDRWFYNTLLAQ